jgi:hypothetical protein
MTRLTMTHRTRRTAVSAIALSIGLAAAPALAQQSTTDGAAMGTAPDRITCAALTDMEASSVPGAVYFVAGFAEGSSSALDLSAGAGAMDGTTTGGDSSAMTGTAATTLPATEGTDGTSDGGSTVLGAGTEGAAETDLSAGTDGSVTTEGGGAAGDTALGTGTSTDGALETDSDTAATTDGTAGQTGDGALGTGTAGMDMASGSGNVPAGFYEISIADVMSTCAETPDRTIAEVVREQQGMQGG